MKFNIIKDEYERSSSVVKNESLNNTEINAILGHVGKHSDVPDSEFDRDQLWKGILVEFEHVPDYVLDNDYEVGVAVAKSIAKDHLSEDFQYYSKLEKMENEFKD